MSQESKRNLLLITLGLLLLARFVVVPALTWQQEKIESNQAKQKQIQKIERLISRADAIESELQRVKAATAKMSERFPTVKQAATFKLATQKKLEQIFSRNRVKIMGLTWMLDIPEEIYQSNLKVSFQANADDLARVQLELASNKEWYDLLQWKCQLKDMSHLTMGSCNGYMVLAIRGFGDAS